MKKSFSLLELILVILIISFIYTSILPKKYDNKLEEITNRIHLYLSYVRYQALIDDKYDLDKEKWYKKRWTLKFFNCDKTMGEIYFVIYSDTSKSGVPKVIESLRDPLSNKYIYNSNSCKENPKYSKYALLTKNYDIDKVKVSCNSTKGIGQISFGNDGKVYTKLSEKDKYVLKNTCYIILKNRKNEEKILSINRNGHVKLEKPSL